MRAVHCTKDGSHNDLEIVDIDPPGPPGEGEVQVAVAARGIQFSDLVRIAGDYQVKTPHPFAVGGEGAGTIAALGPGVEGLREGDLVLTPGGCVETINVRASAVTPHPRRRRPARSGLLP